MGYNRADYIKIRNEFSDTYQVARQLADERRTAIHAELPEIFAIDRELSKTGLKIMGIIKAGGDTEAAIAALHAGNDALIAEREALLVANGYPADYTDVHYDCPKCGDTGFIDTVMCDCMKKALVRAGFESSGLGGLIGKQRFDNFDFGYYSDADGARARVEKNARILKQFADGFSADTYSNFLLLGTTGLGKTHLSTAVAERVIERGFDVLYVSSISMLGDFEERRFGNSGMSPYSNDTQRYYECDLLIIDDLGTEVVNKFTQAYLYEVINTRINNRKCTIINTNLTASDIMATYTDRIHSRVFGEYLPLSFTGVDIRRQKSLGK